MEIERLKGILAEIPPLNKFQLHGDTVAEAYLFVLAEADFLNQPLKPARNEQHEAQRMMDRLEHTIREDKQLKDFGQLRCYGDLLAYAQQTLELQRAELTERIHNLSILALIVFPYEEGLGWSLKLREILAELSER